MKSRYFTLVAILVAIVTLVHWWFLLPGPVSNHSADFPGPAKSAAPKPATIYIQSRKSVPADSESTPAISAAAQVTTADPGQTADSQASLKSAIPDLVRRLRTGDRVDAFKAYTPPNEYDDRRIQQMQGLELQALGVAAEDSAFHQIYQKNLDDVTRAFTALEDQTPTLNASGDEATYELSLPGRGKTPLTFVNISGKWYIKNIWGD